MEVEYKERQVSSLRMLYSYEKKELGLTGTLFPSINTRTE